MSVLGTQGLRIDLYGLKFDLMRLPDDSIHWKKFRGENKYSLLSPSCDVVEENAQQSKQ